MDKNMQQTYPAEMPMESPMQQQNMPCPYMNTCPYSNTCPYMQQMQQGMPQNMTQSMQQSMQGMMQMGQEETMPQGGSEMRSPYYGHYGHYYPYPYLPYYYGPGPWVRPRPWWWY